MVEDIVDVLGMADVDLMGLSQKGVVPDLHKGVVTHAEQEMSVVLEVDGIEFIPVQGLHLDLNGHLFDVVPPDRCVFKDHP